MNQEPNETPILFRDVSLDSAQPEEAGTIRVDERLTLDAAQGESPGQAEDVRITLDPVEPGELPDDTPDQSSSPVEQPEPDELAPEFSRSWVREMVFNLIALLGVAGAAAFGYYAWRVATLPPTSQDNYDARPKLPAIFSPAPRVEPQASIPMATGASDAPVVSTVAPTELLPTPVVAAAPTTAATENKPLRKARKVVVPGPRQLTRPTVTIGSKPAARVARTEESYPVFEPVVPAIQPSGPVATVTSAGERANDTTLARAEASVPPPRAVTPGPAVSPAASRPEQPSALTLARDANRAWNRHDKTLALAKIDLALKAADLNGDTCLELGWLLDAMGETDLAYDVWKRGLALDPSHRELRKLLATLGIAIPRPASSGGMTSARKTAQPSPSGNPNRMYEGYTTQF